MRVALFTHSLRSDWNHGNAHFLRGVMTELLARGHHVEAFEPRDGWSLAQLRAHHGETPLVDFRAAYPHLDSGLYEPASVDLDRLLDGFDLVVVHEWTDPAIVRGIGECRRDRRDFGLLFHDTHHRMVTDPPAMDAYDLREYDGVLAFGESLRQVYLERGVAERVWTWHEAADVRLFRPLGGAPEGDVVWIGNWGDEERTGELREFLIEPVAALGVSAQVHGVRYPEEARSALADARIAYMGWVPNFRVPEIYARFRATLHIPRRPYLRALPGIPTIRVFEALACGIPLVSTGWEDVEGLFEPGEDFLEARTGGEVRERLRELLFDGERAAAVAAHGRRTILARHTCAHRVDELLRIVDSLGIADARPAEALA